MALKESNKDRRRRLKDQNLTEWIPLKNLAKKESEADVFEVINYWKPLENLAKKESEKDLTKL